MLDFHVQRFSRRCAETGRELKPGDTFFSVLEAQGDEVVRSDYSQDAWKGAPENAIGWWKSRAPLASAKTVTWAPNDVILHYFRKLEESSDQRDLRFVLALLMVRRRLVRVETTETDAEGNQIMVLFRPRDESEHRVVVSHPSPERISEIQDKLADLLFGDHAELDLSEEETSAEEPQDEM